MNNTPDNNTNIPAGSNKRSSPLLKVLPLLMSYGVMPLLLDDLGNYSNISPYFLISVFYSYARLVLVNILLVRTLAVWRAKREEKQKREEE